MDGYIGGMIPKKKKKQTGVFNPLESQLQGINTGTRNPPTQPYWVQRSPSALSNKTRTPPLSFDLPTEPEPEPEPETEAPLPPGFGDPDAPPLSFELPSNSSPVGGGYGTDLDDAYYDPSWEDFPMPPNITPEQMEFLQNYVTYMSGMLERLGSDEAFLPEFEYPEFSDFYPEDYYERVVRDPAMSRFTETTMPNLRESMGSGFWSTARQKGEQKAMTDLDQMLLAEQAKMESERTKSRTQWEQDRAKMQLQHTGMEEKARQNYMNQMLGMLGISPFDTVVPGEAGGGLPGFGGGSIWDSLSEFLGL